LVFQRNIIMKIKKISKLLIILFLYSPLINAQNITLNDGFEGTPEYDIPPPHWRNWSDFGNSSVDTQPGLFNNDLPASEGETYISLVTRAVNTPGTVEIVWAKLIKPFEKDKCYNLQLDLSLSNTFSGGFGPIYFNNPCIFRLIGFNGPTHNITEEEILWESDSLTNFNWETFKIQITPQVSTYEYIALKPFFTPPSNHQNSAVLVDNLRFKITPNLIVFEEGEINLPEGALEINWYFNGDYVEGEHSVNIPFQGNGTYKATFIDASGCFTITTIAIFIDLESIKIYPNPTNSEITIESNSLTNEPCKFIFYNELGQLVFEHEFIQHKGLNKTELDLSFLAPAVYYLKINKNDLNNDIHKIIVGQ